MKGKMRQCRGRCAYEGVAFKKPLAQICHLSLSKMVPLNKQNQPKNGMKGKMRPCRGRCADVGEDVPM